MFCGYALPDIRFQSRRALQYQDGDHDIQNGFTTLQERRNILHARLNTWFKVQAVYVPVAQGLRELQFSEDVRADGHVESDEESDNAGLPSMGIDAEKVKLYLPSQLPPSLWSTGCVSGLHDIEFKLRVAQASDALEQLKQHLCVHSGLIRYKITQVSGPGQKANTRARNLLDRLREKILRCAERYRVAHGALEILAPTGDWQENLRPLLASDIKGPNANSPDDVFVSMSKASKRSRVAGEGLRQLSWIWRVRRKNPHSNAESDLDTCELS